MNRKARIITVVAVAVLLCLLSAPFAIPSFENWRARCAWEDYKRQLEAQGEHLDVDAFFPTPVPDAQNFTQSPAYLQMNGPENSFGFSDWANYQTWETGVRRDFYVANEALAIQRGMQPVFDELYATAAKYPYSQASVPFLQKRDREYFSSMTSLVSAMEENTGGSIIYPHWQFRWDVFDARIAAELKLNRSEDAFADLEILFRGQEAFQGTPFNVGSESRMIIMTFVMQPIWEGIAAHEWTPEQLEKIESWLRKINFLADFQQTYRSERAWHNAVWEHMRAIHADRLHVCKAAILPESGYGESTSGTASWMQAARQKFRDFYDTQNEPGTLYLNQLRENRFIQEKVLTLVDPKSQRVDVRRTNEIAAYLENWRDDSHYFESWMVLKCYLFIEMLPVFAWAQTEVNLAMIACEIERYRLAHGALPGELEDLHMPGLPHDLVTGGPLHYHIIGDHYVLYSTGWNGIDEKGRVVKKSDPYIDKESHTEGDWSWSLKPLQITNAP